MLLNYFKKLSVGWKAFVILFIIAFFYIAYLGTKIAYLHYQRVKYIKENIELIQNEKLETEKRIDSNIKKGEDVNKRSVIINKAIDKKLEDDKNNIDNSDYPDAKLDSLLSRYSN